MKRASLLTPLVILVVTSGGWGQKAWAAAPADPFATAPADPFASTASEQETRPLTSKQEAEDKAIWLDNKDLKDSFSQQLAAQSYFQANDINRHHAFNPNLTQFNENAWVTSLDYGAKLLLDDTLSGLSARTRWLYQDEVSDWGQSDRQSQTDFKALEAYLNWHSSAYQWQGQLGRVKTDWGNGFNWNLTNMLRPYQDQPYADQDDLLQQTGWNMANLTYSQGPWFYQGLVAELEDNNVTGESNQGDAQYVLRFGYQGGMNLDLLLHKLPGQKLNYALSLSQLLGEATTLRAQWRALHQRDQETSTLLANYDGASQSVWQQALIGVAFTFNSGANLQLEYLYTEHGYTDEEWDYISTNSESAYSNIENGWGSSADYNYLTAALNSLNYAQLRQHYLYVMYASPISDALWQYRQSVQLNLDDDSQLHRVELLKSWNAHFTSRVQLEAYQGCDDCEYGLNPNEHTVRAVFKWDF